MIKEIRSGNLKDTLPWTAIFLARGSRMAKPTIIVSKGIMAAIGSMICEVVKPNPSVTILPETKTVIDMLKTCSKNSLIPGRGHSD